MSELQFKDATDYALYKIDDRNKEMKVKQGDNTLFNFCVEDYKAGAEWHKNNIWHDVNDRSIIAGNDVESESVGQFIGRKDNKLTKIFDGDIITVNGHYPKLVKFIPERAAFCLANISDLKNQEWWDIWQQPHSSWWDEMEIEVIGNKFDNPELLED